MGGHKNFLLGAVGIGWLLLAPSIPLVGSGMLLTFAHPITNFKRLAVGMAVRSINALIPRNSH